MEKKKPGPTKQAARIVGGGVDTWLPVKGETFVGPGKGVRELRERYSGMVISKPKVPAE